jgi:hypothetical protein
MDHPARYALVELENLHDPAQQFEPIHRAIFGTKESAVTMFEKELDGKIKIEPAKDAQAMIEAVNATPDGTQKFGILEKGKAFVATFAEAPSVICVGSIQQLLDKFLAEGKYEKIDYIHGAQDLADISAGEDVSGFYLPPVSKNGFFQGIIHDGALPRKTFSMGEAHEKRFYIESQQILD